MAQDIVNKNQNISYTNLDFSSIYTEILELIKQKQYDEIIVVLEKEQEKQRLSNKYDLALEISRNIKKISK